MTLIQLLGWLTSTFPVVLSAQISHVCSLSSRPNSSSFRVAPFLVWSCTPRLTFFLTLDNLLRPEAAVRPGLLPPFDHTQQSKTQRLSWYQINHIPKGVRECLPLENQGMLLWHIGWVKCWDIPVYLMHLKYKRPELIMMLLKARVSDYSSLHTSQSACRTWDTQLLEQQ